jgi:hypothetical protein
VGLVGNEVGCSEGCLVGCHRIREYIEGNVSVILLITHLIPKAALLM